MPRLDVETIEVAVHGDTAVSWGVYYEDLQIKGSPPERLRVRSTKTLQKDEGGRLITILGHRDVQPFDGDGRYIPVPTGEWLRHLHPRTEPEGPGLPF